jgi:hypothetical protein
MWCGCRIAAAARRRPAIDHERDPRDPRTHHGVICRLAPDSEPPQENEEAQPEGQEEAVLGIKIGWLFPALRRLRGGRRGEGVSHWPVSLLSVNLMVPSLVQIPDRTSRREIYAEGGGRSIPEGAGQSRRRLLSQRATSIDVDARLTPLDPTGNE